MFISNGDEDGFFTLNLTVTRDPFDTTNSALSVMISDVPPGAIVLGATFNVLTGRYTAPAANVMAGLVTIIPPPDFSGNLNVTVEAVATSPLGAAATTAPQILPVVIKPIADGPAISLSAPNGLEDVPLSVSIGISEIDIDGSEEIGEFVYLLISDNALLNGTYAIVDASDSDAIVAGESVVGYIRVPLADLANPLDIIPPLNWHGTFEVTVAAWTFEPTGDPLDPDTQLLSRRTFAVSVDAVADPPILTVPAAPVTGLEDTNILIPDLSAVLFDNVTINGAELLSAFITGVPEGSILSAGFNNGDGSWTVPPNALPNLSILPPREYSGTMNLTLFGVALEIFNGDEALSSAPFTVIVEPVADTFLILARDATLGPSGVVPLDLNIRMVDTRGDEPGENPGEIITLTFTNVPDGVFLFANQGGRITDLGGGIFTFEGTEEQSNSLSLLSGPGTSPGTSNIGISGVTRDGNSILATPVTDSFRLVVSDPPTIPGVVVSDPSLLIGTNGNDILIAGPVNNVMDGGDGTDRFIIDRTVDNFASYTISGGNGGDSFIWSGPIPSLPDVIIGFNETQGDKIVLTELLPGFDLQFGHITIGDFVQLLESPPDTVVRIDPTGTGNFPVTNSVVVLQGRTGLNLQTLFGQGAIVA